jgi:Holliday junction resolvasome RuvABC ATP-dependent DNA helicase subunit
MKQLRRRDLAKIITGAAMALRVPLQAQTAPDLEQKARESKRAAAAELTRVDLPAATEPAFHFQA